MASGKISRWIGALGLGLSLLTGSGLVTPQGLAQSSSPPAVDEEFNAQMVSLFAKVVLALEPVRVAAQQRADTNPDPTAKEDIRKEFIRKAAEVIIANGMTIPDYNKITLRIRAPEGSELKKRIEQEVIAQQQQQVNQPRPATAPSP